MTNILHRFTKETGLHLAAIVFHTGRAVEPEAAFAYTDAYEGGDGYASPERVVWSDGSESWAKGWWSTNGGHLCTVGAGAYGNLIVLERAS